MSFTILYCTWLDSRDTLGNLPSRLCKLGSPCASGRLSASGKRGGASIDSDLGIHSLAPGVDLVTRQDRGQVLESAGLGRQVCGQVDCCPLTASDSLSYWMARRRSDSTPSEEGMAS